MIDSITINNTEYQVRLPAIISSSADSLITSEYLYELFENKILKEFIEQGVCQKKRNDQYRFIKCRQKIDLGERYSIKNNQINMELPSNRFISVNRYFDIIDNIDQEIYNIHNLIGIVLGPQFLSQFNYTVFDYEKKQIEFYSDRFNLTSFQNNNCDLIIKLTLSESVIGILNIIILIYSNIKLREE